MLTIKTLEPVYQFFEPGEFDNDDDEGLFTFYVYQSLFWNDGTQIIHKFYAEETINELVIKLRNNFKKIDSFMFYELSEPIDLNSYTSEIISTLFPKLAMPICINLEQKRAHEEQCIKQLEQYFNKPA